MRNGRYRAASKRLLVILGVVLTTCASVVLFFPGAPADDEALVERAYQQLWQGGAENTSRAVESFAEALRRDPASTYRWCDLGEALMEAGDEQKARYCFTRAAELGRNSPPILMRVANFHFRTGDSQRALYYMSLILEQVEQYDGIIFNSYTHLGRSVEEILKYGIPDDRRVGQSYLRYLLRRGNVPDAVRAWRWITEHNFADDRSAAEYVNYLLGDRQYDAAARAWSKYLGKRRTDYLQSNYLYNGGFEFAPTGAMLDWRIRRAGGVEVARDSSVRRSGGWSLRLRFEGKENVNYGHTSQTAVVGPGRHYLEADVRTEELTTDQGVGFRIFDPEAPARLDVRTENLTGTTDWRRVGTDVVVPSGTKLVEVQLTRRPSLKIDNKIAGTAWVDELRLVPVADEGR